MRTRQRVTTDELIARELVAGEGESAVRALPVGTVRSRCFYALENLRLALDEAGAR